MDQVQAEIDDLRAKCVGCGMCRDVCPSLKHGGVDPLLIMQGGDENIRSCISCGNCSRVCEYTDPYIVMKDVLSKVNGVHVSQTYRDCGLAMPVQDVPSASLECRWTGDDVYVMPGCMVRCRFPFLEYAASVALDSMGIRCSEIPDTSCCLHPVQFREMPESERQGAKSSIGRSAGGGDIVTLCGGCHEELEAAGEGSEHIIQFLHRKIGSLPRFDEPLRVALEPGCSSEPYADEMVEVVKALGCECIGNGWGCCGKGTDVSTGLMADREAECADADLIVVGCPTCFMKFDSQAGGRPVVHIAELVAMAAGDRESLRYHTIPVMTPE